ncbi:MAG: hypothetical protein AAGH92_13125 [Planctomycetota bacterium]
MPSEAPSLIIYVARAEHAALLPRFEESGVVPMLRARFHYAHGPRRQGTDFWTARPDFEIARDVLRQRDALPKGAPVGLFLHCVGEAHGVLGPIAQPALHPPGRSPEALARGGFVEFTRDHVRRVMQRLNVAGLEPDQIILDYEVGWRKGDLGIRDGQRNPVAYREDVETVWRAAIDVMPEELRALGPESMLPSPSPAVAWLYNQWGLQRRNIALATAVYEPVHEAFGRRVAVSNYLEQVRAWPTRDLNNNVKPVIENIRETWSAPQAYLSDISGQRYRGLPQSKALAKVWADQRDEVRAALSWSPNVSPWHGRPDFGRPDGWGVEAWRWAWAAGLLHDRMHGVERVLLFSGGAWSEDEAAFASRVFIALQSLTPDQTSYRPNLEPVPNEEAEAWMAGWIARAKALIGEVAPTR